MMNQYDSDISKILNEVNSKNITLAVQIASIPDMGRGYGHIKEENISKASKKEMICLNFGSLKKVVI